MTFINNYDTCEITGHRDDPTYRVLSCTNILNENDKHFLYNNKFSMCANHYCAITYDITSQKHNTLTCSGSILVFKDSSFFNPINILRPLIEQLIQFPSTSNDLFGNNFRYYYVKDTRTSFVEDIIDLNCTNDFSTCLKFENGASFCMGNVLDVRILRSIPSLVLGFSTSFLIVCVVYLLLREHLGYMKNFVTVFVYCFPLLGISLIMNYYFAINVTSYVFGNIIVVFFFPLLISYTETYFSAYNRKVSLSNQNEVMGG
jgi:hypothetical protein